jgi:CBS domain-containing protein
MLLRDTMSAKAEDLPANTTLMQAAEKMMRLVIGAMPVRDAESKPRREHRTEWLPLYALGIERETR